MENDILVLDKDMFFKKGEDIYIHRSFSEYNGIMHKHNFIELIYVISGSATHRIEDKEYSVRKGNVVMVDYGTPHAFTFNPEDEETFETYDLLFTPDFFNVSILENNDFYSLASSYLFSSIFTEFKSPNIPQNLIKTNQKEFKKIFDKIYDEYNARRGGFQCIIRAYLIELIIKIFREIDTHHPAFTENHQELVQRAIDYMRENYMSHISLDNIVSNIFLSKNYFRQIFKKTTGISISTYIQDLRISEAKRLLTETSDSSSKIAYECGFNDTKFFYQTFKKSTGLTPAEYRKQYKG